MGSFGHCADEEDAITLLTGSCITLECLQKGGPNCVTVIQISLWMQGHVPLHTRPIRTVLCKKYELDRR